MNREEFLNQQNKPKITTHNPENLYMLKVDERQRQLVENAEGALSDMGGDVYEHQDDGSCHTIQVLNARMNEQLMQAVVRRKQRILHPLDFGSPDKFADFDLVLPVNNKGVKDFQNIGILFDLTKHTMAQSVEILEVYGYKDNTKKTGHDLYILELEDAIRTSIKLGNKYVVGDCRYGYGDQFGAMFRFNLSDQKPLILLRNSGWKYEMEYGDFLALSEFDLHEKMYERLRVKNPSLLPK